ncbi:SDR family oxidoreductase [Roseomonas sp. SSH11]|uniref:SDR family oxidoreductase n=1 Tax=Pararoseomonas baculiformis TaxID=2820812 RepID=A0ABS4AIY1_9PROT|nr:SDR family oxidoreductase [Pararoseomonas baculiformis]MBP0446983.1 SDR family oxidoreductase [Pararoseomonas baculiformis]
MQRRLEGMRALVSGASRGIGLAIARRLAADGARVMLVARSGAALEEAVAALPGCAAHPTDLSRPEAAAEAVEAAIRQFGGLDLLVHSAGATQRGDFLALDDAAWMDGYGLKLFGAVRLCRAAWPHLRASGGSAVLIAGVGGRVASADFTIGGSVNAALMNLTKALADRGVADGVRVNAINPGSIRTGRLTGRIETLARERGLESGDAARALADQTGVSRFGEPEEIAGVVSFLAGPDASYIQGAILDVDGGWVRAV